MYCYACNKDKAEEEFRKLKGQGLNKLCRSCCDRRRYQTKGVGHYIQRRYGITPADYELLYSEQKGKCAICKLPELDKSLHVDHDHGTGLVRGLLCAACNKGLGFFKDRIESLEEAIEYLKWAAVRNA